MRTTELLLVVLAAVATTLMLESVRVFVAYLVFVVDQSQRTELAGSAFAVFAAIGLGGVLVRLAGVGRLVPVIAALLVGVRLVLQFWEQPDARVVLGAAGVIAWGWLIVALLAVSRDAVAFGLVLGMGIDLAIRIGFLTVDLPWMPGIAAHIVTLLLAATIVLVLIDLGWYNNLAATGSGNARSLIAIGPGLAVYHLMTGNLGLAQAQLNLSFPSAAVLMALGFIAGAGATAFILAAPERINAARVRGLLPIAVTGILVLAATWLFWERAGLTKLGMVAGVAGSVILLALAVSGGRGERGAGPVAIGLWVMLSMLIQAAILFTYYSFTGRPSLTVVAWLLLIVGAFFNSGSAPVLARHGVPTFPQAAALLAILLVIACGWQLATWNDPEPGPLAGGELRVMTYNIQSGFAADNHWSLQLTARTIEAANPDVVVLEEVSRGWLVTTGVDELTWLSQRLKMPVAFGPNSHDGLWGNAILSRVPMTSTAHHSYTTSENLDRGLVEAHIETQSGGVWIFGTHLDNPNDAAAVRAHQTQELLGFINGRTPAVLLGDLNTDPGSDVITMLQAAGFSDPGAQLPPGSYTSEDRRRIDYILTSPGITTTHIDTIPIWTSDHLPVVATLRIGGS